MKCVKGYDLKVLRSAAGYYIGTEAPLDERFPESLAPYCRFSGYMSEKQAREALKDSELLWTYDRNSDEQFWCAGGSCLSEENFPDC